MKASWIVALTVLGTIVAAAVTALVVLGLGAVNIGADVQPGWIEAELASWSRERTIERRAPKAENPYAGDPSAIAEGMKHYRANCLICHGAPGTPITEIARGLNPPAPALGDANSGPSDAELFWVTKHGIRFTSMPAFGSTHSDEQIWKIVAFLRHLPKLTKAEQKSLRDSLDDEAWKGVVVPHEVRSVEAPPHEETRN